MIKGAPAKPKPAHVSTVNRVSMGNWDLGVHNVHFDVNQRAVVVKILEEQFQRGNGNFAAYNMAKAIIKLASQLAAADTGKRQSAIVHEFYREIDYDERYKLRGVVLPKPKSAKRVLKAMAKKKPAAKKQLAKRPISKG